MALNLAITWNELRIIVGNQQGFSLNPDQWSAKQLYVVDQVLQSGVSRVYHPKAIDGKEIAVEWSFLRPQSNLDVPAGVNLITLPMDFGSFVGQLTIDTSSSVTRPWAIEWINEGKIREMYQEAPAQTGPPRYACEVPTRAPDQKAGHLKQLFVFPIPDQEYTIGCTYNINPNRLTGSQPQCYGGPQYRELFIESCLAVAEQRFDNLVGGPHSVGYNEMLMGAISSDNRNKPQKLGYNGNREEDIRSRHQLIGPATYNGQSFD